LLLYVLLCKLPLINRLWSGVLALVCLGLRLLLEGLLSGQHTRLHLVLLLLLRSLLLVAGSQLCHEALLLQVVLVLLLLLLILQRQTGC
jgi:hypothetical protein